MGTAVEHDRRGHWAYAHVAAADANIAWFDLDATRPTIRLGDVVQADIFNTIVSERTHDVRLVDEKILLV